MVIGSVYKKENQNQLRIDADSWKMLCKSTKLFFDDVHVIDSETVENAASIQIHLIWNQNIIVIMWSHESAFGNEQKKNRIG